MRPVGFSVCACRFTREYGAAFEPEETPSTRPDEAALVAALQQGSPGPAGRCHHVSLLPHHVHGTDGFFVARWTRR